MNAINIRMRVCVCMYVCVCVCGIVLCVRDVALIGLCVCVCGEEYEDNRECGGNCCCFYLYSFFHAAKANHDPPFHHT